MAQYVLNNGLPAASVPGMVARQYNIALGNGTQTFGYIFYNEGQSSNGFVEKTDVATKQALVNYGSPNLVDRDLAFYPRVTQGDFSGGSLQEVAIDLTKFFDSDLEIRTPGYLVLRPAWQRQNLSASPVNPPQILTWNSNTYVCFGESRYYNLAGTQYAGAGIPIRFLDTDGNSLQMGDGVNHIKYTNDNIVYSDIATATGAFTGMWLVSQGTNGRFMYYATSSGNDINSGADQLFKVDMTAIPVAAGVLVATNLTRYNIVDLVGYQSGIAILANDPGGMSMTVWYHDGVNMTPIVRVNQYTGQGITVCLGDLYVTAASTGNFEGPVLMRIGSGTFDVVARPANPLTLSSNAGIGAPVSSGQYIAFALSNPQISQVTSTPYVGVYDAISNAYSHAGSLDATDAPQTTGPRQLAWSGRALCFAYSGSGTGFAQFQTNSSLVPAISSPVPLYAASGWMVSSRLDFGTPGIAKRFRRITILHPPLLAGEAFLINAYVDQDQLHNSFTVASAPVPSSATVSNTTVGSTSTTLNFGVDTIGRTLFFTFRLTAGTNQQTTPDVIYVAVEIGGTYTWEFDLDCSSQRRTLDQRQLDPQGINGKDLYYMLRNSYENGNNLTLYLSEGVSYTVAIESLNAQTIAYADKANVLADQEWRVKAVLRQTL